MVDIGGDSSADDPAEDILAGFAERDAAFVTFRMDIAGAIPPNETCEEP